MSSASQRPQVVLLGSSGAIQVPAFFCTCEVCEAARKDPRQRRTRASLVLLGEETVLVDANPDLEFQLDRERIRRVDRIFITHWHFDHVAALGALAEPASIGGWSPIDIYLPQQTAHHFDQELAYMKRWVRLHPVAPGDRLELPDAAWEVVKTAHTDDSVGFIIESSQRLAYLVDGTEPPAETLARLGDVDCLVLDALLDELDEEHWMHFSVAQAVDFWHRTGVPDCILTHLSCHSWKNKRLVAGFSHAQRCELELRYPRLRFACDGMRIAP